MSAILQKVSKLMLSSFQQTALMQGTSDIIVVRWRTGELKCTPFLACFGSHPSSTLNPIINIYINHALIPCLSKFFYLDKYGYMNPKFPQSHLLALLQLNPGRNIIQFQLCDKKSNNLYNKFITKCKIQAQIYLYQENEKLLISDMDGTVTKSDMCGIYSNYKGIGYLHNGYSQLIQGAYKNGYKIVWLTMRSMPLYNFSKKYLRQQSQMHGPLLTEPEQFFPALKKQLLHKTSNIKANMLLGVRSLFPSHINPFIGGLGNRQNDAIAYRAAGIILQSIFIIDTQSNVHHFGNNSRPVSYEMMSKQVQQYFPRKKSINIFEHQQQKQQNKFSQKSIRQQLSQFGQKIKSKLIQIGKQITQ